MSNALRQQIEKFAAEFASQVVTAIRGATLEDILQESSGAAPAKRGPGRPRKDSTSPGPGPTTKLLRNVDLIVPYVKSHPGETGENVRKVLGIDKGPWNKAMSHLGNANLLRKQGEKRGTRYWVV